MHNLAGSRWGGAQGGGGGLSLATAAEEGTISQKIAVLKTVSVTSVKTRDT